MDKCKHNVSMDSGCPKCAGEMAEWFFDFPVDSGFIEVIMGSTADPHIHSADRVRASIALRATARAFDILAQACAPTTKARIAFVEEAIGVLPTEIPEEWSNRQVEEEPATPQSFDPTLN